MRPQSVAEERFIENLNFWEHQIHYLTEKKKQLEERKEMLTQSQRRGVFSQQQLTQIREYMGKTHEYLSKGTSLVDSLEERLEKDDDVKLAEMEETFNSVGIASPPPPRHYRALRDHQSPY
jgi:hypothetical protein